MGLAGAGASNAETRIITAGAEGEANRLVAESLTADRQLRIVEALSDQALGYLLGSDGPTPVIPVPTPSTTPSTISFDHLLDHPREIRYLASTVGTIGPKAPSVSLIWLRQGGRIGWLGARRSPGPAEPARREQPPG